MCGFHTLPHELQIQILRYLPPTAVFSLRLVCTAWNTILSSPHTERAVSLSLLFPSTALDLRSRLRRRQRLLRGDPVQIWDVDEGALTKYCDGYVVACNGMSTKAGDLGIWDCRRKKKEEDACVTVVDLWKVVRERYPELWSEWKFGGTLLEREEVNIEEPEHTGTCGVKPGYKPWVRDFFAQNGVVVVVLGGMNPSIPTNRQILLAFSLSTGTLLQTWKLKPPVRIFDARITPSILLLITLAANPALPGDPAYDPSTPYEITTFSIPTGVRLHTQPAPHSKPYQIALDNLDQFYLPSTNSYSVHNAHTGALTTTIPLPSAAPSSSCHHDSTLFTSPCNRIHYISTTAPLPSDPDPDLDLLLPDDDPPQHHTIYTSWTASAPHRRTTVVLPPLDGLNITGTPDLSSYLDAVRWGAVLGDYYHFGQRCWAYNVSGRNNEVVTVGTCEVPLKRCLPLRCYLDAPVPAARPGKGWRRFKALWKVRGRKQGGAAVAEEEEDEAPCRTRAPALPDGVVCSWLPGELRDAEFKGGDDGVWVLCVPVGKEKWPTKMVMVSFDPELVFPEKGWMERRQ